MKTLLILTGPQGSGNHMWSKIFALHPQVSGWSALLDNYWIGHDQEPWANCWQDPSLLSRRNWGTHNYYVTSVSVPYMNNGVATVPDFKTFAQQAQAVGLLVKFAVLGRDRNIVEMQQQRVRKGITLSQAMSEFAQFAQPTFLSYELLHLYREQYLQQLSQLLAFPIAYRDPRLKEIIQEDTNAKYFSAVDHHPTDDLAHKTSRKWK
ncbi:hypothetical protein UFOVP328_69 [uncultured Caudovirales phage]|uniref:Uncharacterized protein n=1 Tax=uncultured Caudovirales phage TaxID=2100421 RepID=A0A6J5LX55_9CAUD|nr:hypothetical protein UFOVP328_69 [uncultured Caudovirales phage]